MFFQCSGRVFDDAFILAFLLRIAGSPVRIQPVQAVFQEGNHGQIRMLLNEEKGIRKGSIIRGKTEQAVIRAVRTVGRNTCKSVPAAF